MDVWCSVGGESTWSLECCFLPEWWNFLLRGGSEHRELKLSQIKKNTSPEGRERYTYTEHVSKNCRGGIGQLELSHKVVHQFRDDRLGERCHVFILDKYYSKLPACALDQDVFYLCLITKVPTKPAAPWFTSAPIGKNTLSKMVKTMCEQASIDGKRTNHSLRATGITTMFQAGLPEKVIQDRVGTDLSMVFANTRESQRNSRHQHAKSCQEVLQKRHVPLKDCRLFSTTCNINHSALYTVNNSPLALSRVQL